MDKKAARRANNSLAKSFRSSRVEERYVFGKQLEFTSINDHILPSICHHEQDDPCQVCHFEKELSLPSLPEMIFPHNCLSVKLIAGEACPRTLIEFNAFDALRLVEVGKLPDVKVGPSAAWMESRKETPVKDVQYPFDWTYTSEYKGSVGEGVRIEPTNEKIDYEKLKRHDPILFYSKITLYEDELADNGCAQMSVRVRVMPDCFFLLCRFYMRVDHVMVRVYDTRLFGVTHSTSMIREWSKREALYSQLTPEALQNVLNPDAISSLIPSVSVETCKLSYL